MATPLIQLICMPFAHTDVTVTIHAPEGLRSLRTCLDLMINQGKSDNPIQI